jgi:hypothetical protein
VTHLTPEQLGDVDEVAGHEHLRTCARCHARWQEQRDVRDLLRGLPEPAVIPPDVATGLAQALRRLSPDDVDHMDDIDHLDADASAGGAGRTVVPLRPAAARRDPSRRTPWLAAAAAVIVLGGGGAALVTQPWGGAGGDTSAGSSASAPQEAREDMSARASAAAARVRSTGTDYERANLSVQVRRELLGGGATPSGGPGRPFADDGSTPAGDTRLASPGGLASCLSALGVDAGQVTAVDLARFEGQPAAIVVLGDPTGAHDVWVVGRGCRPGDDQTRYFVRLP